MSQGRRGRGDPLILDGGGRDGDIDAGSTPVRIWAYSSMVPFDGYSKMSEECTDPPTSA